MEVIWSLVVWQCLLAVLAVGLLLAAQVALRKRVGVGPVIISAWMLLVGSVLGLMGLLLLRVLVVPGDYLLVLGPPVVTLAICAALIRRLRSRQAARVGARPV